MKASHRAQINRENAKNSIGPTSKKGKQKACLNGFKHGLTGQRMILQDHELDVYPRLGACNMRLNRAAAIDSNLLTEPSQLGRSDTGMCFVFNKGTPKVSTTF